VPKSRFLNWNKLFLNWHNLLVRLSNYRLYPFWDLFNQHFISLSQCISAIMWLNTIWTRASDWKGFFVTYKSCLLLRIQYICLFLSSGVSGCSWTQALDHLWWPRWWSECPTTVLMLQANKMILKGTKIQAF
jgi:hypothetical protein